MREKKAMDKNSGKRKKAGAQGRLRLKNVRHRELTAPDGERRCFVFTGGMKREDIYEDVKNGVFPFEPVVRDLNENELRRRITIIKTRSLENGLKAVSYLAPIHARMDEDAYCDTSAARTKSDRQNTLMDEDTNCDGV